MKTYYVYINGEHTDTIQADEGYTAENYRYDYNINWIGQPEELTDEEIELIEQPEDDEEPEDFEEVVENEIMNEFENWLFNPEATIVDLLYREVAK